MELRQLAYFAAVAEERSFSRAARRVNIVQSGLSASIRALEQELGLILLVRTTRRVDLTEAGRVFLAEVRRVQAAVQGARDAAESVRGMLRGTVHIGTMQRLAPLFDLPAVLARFRAQHPAVEIRLRQSSSGGMMAEVGEGALDFAFLAHTGTVPRGISLTPLGDDPLVFACAAAHPLARHPHVSLPMIADLAFVEFEPQWAVRIMVDRAFSSAHIDRHIAFELNDVPTMLDLVAHGLGVAVLPGFITKNVPGLMGIPLDPPAGRWRLVLARRERHPLGPAARALLGLILPRTPGEETGGRRGADLTARGREGR
ncbi:MAG TPA: LysR family transcriptional regulator [Gemmatimonadales bacterium]|nr:LysR family transcriptional regulator [Gemmatimonadales bacterium]